MYTSWSVHLHDCEDVSPPNVEKVIYTPDIILYALIMVCMWVQFVHEFNAYISIELVKDTPV